MALTIVNQPIIGLSPANNLVYWRITSNLPNIVYFKIDVTVDGESNVVGTFKYYPRPDLLNGCIVEISQLLQSLLRNPFQPMTTAQGMNWAENQVLSIQLKVAEMVLNSSTGQIVQNGGTTTLGRRFFWYGGLNPFEQANLTDWFTYSNSKGRFLTKNRIQRITRQFEGKLNFLIYENVVSSGWQDIDILFQEYDRLTQSWSDFGGQIPTGWTNADSSLRAKRYWNLNVSYDIMSSLAGNPFINEYRVLMMRNGQLLDSVTFIVEDEYCGKEQLPVFWENSYGGWDSTVLFDPYFDYEQDRTTIKLNSTKINREGIYADYDKVNNQIVHNKEQGVINVDRKSKIIANTFDLTDNENVWLNELFNSKQIYIKHQGRYFPVVLEEKKLNTQLKRKSGGVNIKTLSFSIKAF